MSNATFLNHPSPDAKLCLSTDASDTAVGAEVHQIIDGELQPLGFFSMKLTNTEQKSSTYDRELLAIYLEIRRFRSTLEGRQFVICTDHKPLVYAFRQKIDKASPKQIRQLYLISQFTTKILHVSGKDNRTTDTLLLK